MDYKVTIDDPDYVRGIGAAREAYNAGRGPDDPEIKTDQDYVQFVMLHAAESYAQQYPPK